MSDRSASRRSCIDAVLAEVGFDKGIKESTEAFIGSGESFVFGKAFCLPVICLELVLDGKDVAEFHGTSIYTKRVMGASENNSLST
jgi:hypothetical protein